MRFSSVTGTNLHRRQLSLPGDLKGDFNLLLVAFQQWQQALVDTWIPQARQLETEYPGLQYYEIPVIQKMSRIARTFINEGMRAGIPDPATREKTITLYLDKAAFRTALDIPDEETIWILLLDRQGNILWRGEGAYSEEKGAAISWALQQLASITAG